MPKRNLLLGSSDIAPTTFRREPTARISSEFALVSGLLLVVLSALGTSALRAQVLLHGTGSEPSFEVATIKPSPPDAPRGGLGPRGMDTFLTKNVTVKDMIEFAYGIVSDSQIGGLAGWMTSAGFDIDARVSVAEVEEVGKLPPLRRMDPYRLMMQSLLKERFQMKTHFETRELPVYELVVAKSGPKLHASEMDSNNPGETVKRRSLRATGAGSVEGEGVTTSMLAEVLGRLGELGGGLEGRGRMVLDKTNLAGQYDFQLHWTPDQGGNTTSEADSPSLFTALEEQLGLKLVPAKEPLEVIVIDGIDKPTVN